MFHTIKLISKEMFHTSLGLKVVIEKAGSPVSKGDIVEINNKVYTVLDISFSHDPDDGRIILTVKE